MIRGLLLLLAIALFATPYLRPMFKGKTPILLAQLSPPGSGPVDSMATPPPGTGTYPAPLPPGVMPEIDAARAAAAAAGSPQNVHSPEGLERAVREQVQDPMETDQKRTNQDNAQNRASADKAREVMRRQLMQRSNEERNVRRQKLVPKKKAPTEI